MNNDNVARLRSVIISRNMWIWTTICLIELIPIHTISASAQLLPPPVSDLNIEIDEAQTKEMQFQFPTGYQPPNVEILTNVLRDGKNVFKVSITSEGPIRDCKITSAKGEQERTEERVKDSGTVYKALIDAKQPYQTVRIDVWEYADSSSTVEKLLTIQEAIWNSLGSMRDMTKNVLQNIIVPINSGRFWIA